MKWLNRLSAILVGLIGVGIIRDFFSRYDVLVFNKEDVEQARENQENDNQTDPSNPIDLRGTPSHQCVCGSNQFYVRAIFDDYEIATYFLDMICVNCGSLLTAPTPVDRKTE